MDAQTKAEMIDSALGGAAALAKELFLRRQERMQAERQAELQKEIERIRANGGSPDAHSDGEGPGEATGESKAPRRSRPARDRHRGGQTSGRGGVVETLDRATDTVTDVDELLAEAEEMEDCRLCKRLISAARNKPLPEQRRLLPELRDFLASVDDGTPTSEVAKQIRESDALLSLLKDEMGGVMPS